VGLFFSLKKIITYDLINKEVLLGKKEEKTYQQFQLCSPSPTFKQNAESVFSSLNIIWQ